MTNQAQPTPDEQPLAEPFEQTVFAEGAFLKVSIVGNDVTLQFRGLTSRKKRKVTQIQESAAQNCTITRIGNLFRYYSVYANVAFRIELNPYQGLIITKYTGYRAKECEVELDFALQHLKSYIVYHRGAVMNKPAVISEPTAAKKLGIRSFAETNKGE